MIVLSDEQHKAVMSHPGQPLRLIDPATRDPATRQAFVLLRADDYERLHEGAYDASPWTDDEMDLLAAEDADRLGWQGMETYQEPAL
jgi:hypothetical protein